MTTLRAILKGAGTALLVLLTTVPAFAQSQASSGAIYGRILDSTGAGVPGAAVSILAAARGFERAVVTGADGFYTALLIPPGAYDVTASLAGFQTARRTGVRVTVGSNVNLVVTLQPAGVTEEVTVVAETPIIESASSVRTSTLDEEAIANLPINGRRFQDFVTLTPTVQVEPTRGQLSLAGQRGINSNISVDGADYNQPFFGGIRGGERANFAPTIPQEAIQEFQVVAAGYTAEFGRSSGGLVNAVTKSGSNDWHASAFFLRRDKDWASQNALDQDAAFSQNQFGGSLSGPLRKDKAFFLLAYEQQAQTNPRRVEFPVLAGLTPVSTSQEAFDFYKSNEEPFEDTNDAKLFLARIDYQLNPSNRLSFRYSRGRMEALNAVSVGNSLFPNTNSALTNNGTEKDQTDTFVAQLNSTLTNRHILEVRAQYAKETRPRLSNNEEPLLTSSVGLTGTRAFLPTTQSDWRLQLATNLSWLAGQHTVKVGAEYNHVFADQTFGFNQFGAYTFTGATATVLDVLSVGGAVPNRLDSTAANYQRQIGNLTAEFATDEIAFFAQDSWRLRPNFTLNLGLRWEGAFNFTPEANNDFLIGLVKGFQFPVGRSYDPTRIADQTNQWGPRLGFSWDPWKDGRTAVRGFAGLYFARTPLLLMAGPSNNFRVPAGDLSLFLPFRDPKGVNNTIYQQFKLIGIDLNTTPLDQLPNVTPEQITQIAAALGLTPNPFLGAQTIAMANDYENPRSAQFGLGVERELLRGFTVGAEGIYVKTDHLERNINVNLSPPTLRSPTVDPAQRPFYGLPTTPRPIPQLGNTTLRESTARARYRALTFSTRLQRKWGQLSAYYTVARLEADDDNERDAGGFTYQDAFDLDPEYSDGLLDRRHAVNGNFVFFLPWGFDFASGFQYRSGRPYDARVGRDANADTTNNDRPYSAAGVPFKRNAFRNFSEKVVDFRLQKKFKVAGKHQLIVSAEVFNAFGFDNVLLGTGANFANYCANVNDASCGFSGPTNPTFAKVKGADGKYIAGSLPGAPRQWQMGLRYRF